MLLVMDTMYSNTFNAIIIITLLKITFYTKQNLGIIYNARNHIQTKVFENANASTKFPANNNAPRAYNNSICVFSPRQPEWAPMFTWAHLGAHTQKN